MARHGPALVTSVFRGMLQTAQPSAVDSLAEALLALLRSFRDVTLRACATLLQEPAIGAGVSVSACEGIMASLSAAATAPSVPLDVFRDLCGDVVRVVRGQASSDTVAVAAARFHKGIAEA